jgi:formate hydrogenlyase subunit 3/multisubunit Na+/H+ antiporter MnhD subunit
MATPLLVTAFLAFGAGVVTAVAAPTGRLARQLSLGGALIGSLSAGGLAAVVLATNTPLTLRVSDVLQPLGGLAIELDALGAVFVALIAIAGAPASLYALGYTRSLDGQPRGRFTHATFNLFLAALCLVPAAGNVLTFLFAWELMAIASCLLVVSDPGDEAPAAGLWYAVMTHAGYLALLAAFAILAGGGATDFASLRTHAITLSPGQLTAVFVLAAVAFGSKAGLVPVHVWLPRAHPAAPSHVSALMSAAMVKLGLYGALRFCFDLLPPGPAWWGGLLLAVGVVTALTGVLYSVAETHLKRLLAYSTIENVGLMFVGVGFALLMRGYGHPELAAAGVVVCLLHAINHAAFKTLLFLGAGAVVHATHATSLEAYGGLIKRMPATAAFMLIGAVALAALPPLNGFPSEWLTFQMLVAGARHSASELAILLPLALAAVALVAGLAAVSAVRLFGITFLALPRTPASSAAVEAPRTMRAGMAAPALLCVALGLAPAVIVPRLSAIASDLGLAGMPLSSGLALAVPLAGGRYSPLLVVAVLVVAAALAVLLAARRLAPGAVRVDDAWNCGRLIHSPRSEYTAASFAEPLNRVFAGFYRPRQQLRIEVHPASRYFVQAIGYRGRLAPWMEQTLYLPAIAAVRRLGLAAGRLQTGSIHWYLTLLPAALVVLLFVSRWIP